MTDRTSATIGILSLLLIVSFGILGLPQYFPHPLNIRLIIVAIAIAATAIVWLFVKSERHEAYSRFELALAGARLRWFMEQPKRDAYHDQLRFVYRPLMPAVQKMKQGKNTLPKAVGSYDNPWTHDPKIIAQVVDVFDKHLDLVEDDAVRKGWEGNKDSLKRGQFWYGKEQRKWLEKIERQHTLIVWWLRSP
jgi:hypothetical protein